MSTQGRSLDSLAVRLSSEGEGSMSHYYPTACPVSLHPIMVPLSWDLGFCYKGGQEGIHPRVSGFMAKARSLSRAYPGISPG